MIRNVGFLRFALPLFAAALCSGQAIWQTVTDLPGVDWGTLSMAQRQSALRFMQTEDCLCGCGWKLAECRVKDSPCPISTKLAAIVVRDTADGKTADEIRADMRRVINDPQGAFESPVTISTVGDPVEGPDQARLTIVEFSDFQCPFCSKAVDVVKQLRKQFPKDIRVVYKQFPLDAHSEAAMASEASLAAQAQGKFWEMHDLIYAGFPNLNREIVDGYARRLNLDMARFNADMASHKYQARVLAEEKEGEAAGVEGTPTFFFNGRRYNGTFDLASVLPLIQNGLDVFGDVKGPDYSRGLQQGAAELLSTLLEHRFGPLPQWARQRLAAMSTAEMENAASGVFQAAKLQDVFDGISKQRF
jgi:protein-disulfide isomerase